MIAAAIDKYVYIAVNQTFTDDYFLKYSALERVTQLDEIEHPIIREALRAPRRRPGARDREHRRHPRRHRPRLVGQLHRRPAQGAATPASASTSHAGDLAEEACHIEIDLLGEPVGKQDQYIAAFGGHHVLRVPAATARCTCRPLGITDDDAARPRGPPAAVLHRLLAHGLDDPARRPEGAAPRPDDDDMLDNLDSSRSSATQIKRRARGRRHARASAS